MDTDTGRAVAESCIGNTQLPELRGGITYAAGKGKFCLSTKQTDTGTELNLILYDQLLQLVRNSDIFLELFKPIDPTSAINDTKFEKNFPSLPHSSYEWERVYCSFVRTGDVAGARRYMEQIAQSGKSITVGNVSKSQLTMTKYLGVSLIAVVTRVAINNGADELK